MRAHRSLVNRSATFPTTVRLLAAAAVTLLASACTTVNVDMPPLAVQVPGQFDSVDPATAQGSADIAQWWKQLDDPVLSGYIEEGLRQNVDVRIALARINGDGTFAILLKHILPYLASNVFMVFIIQVASGILSESAISMLGLGPLDTQSLGIILNDAKANGALGDGIWWGIFPATILITTIAFSLYLINTSMEGVFNPRLRRE